MSGRVEAAISVPSGVTISVSSGAVSSAVAVTIPAGTYYHTAAGGVDSLGETIETAINQTYGPQGYPQSAAAMQAAVGYGTWSAGWLCNESSGDLAAAFGAPSLAPGGTPVYGVAGPQGGIDKVVGWESVGEYFSGGDVFDASSTDDLCIAWVGFQSLDPVTYSSLISKYPASGLSGWSILVYPSGGLWFRGTNAAGAEVFSSVGAVLPVGSWYVGIAALDRATGKARVGTRTLAGSSLLANDATATAGSHSSAADFRLGASATNNVETSSFIAAAYIGAGSGVAAGLPANLTAALTNFASAVSSSFSVSLSTTTGLYTISNSFWPCSIAWTSTDQRDVLGFEYDFDAPQTAAQVTAALGGYGDFTDGGGYLCNESSGSLAAVFGTPGTLSAVSTPTYGSLGPRGSIDKAIGFDSASDAFSGGNVFNVNAVADLVFAWVGKVTTTPAGSRVWFGKKSGAPGFTFWRNSSGNLNFSAADGSIEPVSTCSQLIGEWHVGIAIIDRTAGTIRVGIQGLRSGTANISSATSIGALSSLVNAQNFVLGNHDATTPDTDLQIAAFYANSGVSVATGLSANLSTALSSFAAYMKAQTGTEQCEGLFLPGCPISLDGDPTQAPRISDLRTTMSPTGAVFGLSGNVRFEHTGIVWSHVDRERVWESAAEYSNASWESFFVTTQMGMGHAWFTPSSAIQIWWENAGETVLLGADYNGGTGLSGWNIVNVASVAVPKAIATWTGLFRVELPKIVSAG
jgi:hypothetical protein